jgi:xanthine dehydrogenase small subunit
LWEFPLRDRVTFFLNGSKVEVGGIAPTTTVLNWLRRTQRLSGTKEGCASGDCGACTVVVTELRDGAVQMQSLNACIALLPMLEGKLLWTIEGIQGPDGALHPSQQAMVDCHGSQCGFCTPGFVMSLYALYHNNATRLGRAEIDDWLAGNLCRCTGYGPIAAAAERMFDSPRPAWLAARHADDAATLQALQHVQTLDIQADGQRMLQPASLDALATVAAVNPDATIVSGATDVGIWVTKQTRAVSTLIHTGRVHDAAFRGIVATPSSIGGTHYRIGAGATHAEAMAVVQHPALTELWRRFAGLQVRNAGTVGGNIANGSPVGDLAPALMALGATLQLRRGEVERQLPLDAFFLAYGRQDRQPGEILVAIDVVLPADPDDLSIHKVSKRFDDDISAVCGAFNIRVVAGRVLSARIAFGGMAATPKRALAVEAALIGKPWTAATVDAARSAFSTDFAPISDARASAAYRLQVAQNLLQRTFIQRTQSHVQTHLVGA